MSRRTGVWVGVATLFTLLNAASAGFFAIKEPMHASAHGALALLGVYWAWWLVARAWRQERPIVVAGAEKLEQLQQSMDAMALEVERIGEAARFSAKLAAEKKEPSS